MALSHAVIPSIPTENSDIQKELLEQIRNIVAISCDDIPQLNYLVGSIYTILIQEAFQAIGEVIVLPNTSDVNNDWNYTDGALQIISGLILIAMAITGETPDRLLTGISGAANLAAGGQLIGLTASGVTLLANIGFAVSFAVSTGIMIKDYGIAKRRAVSDEFWLNDSLEKLEFTKKRTMARKERMQARLNEKVNSWRRQQRERVFQQLKEKNGQEWKELEEKAKKELEGLKQEENHSDADDDLLIKNLILFQLEEDEGLYEKIKKELDEANIEAAKQTSAPLDKKIQGTVSQFAYYVVKSLIESNEQTKSQLQDEIFSRLIVDYVKNGGKSALILRKENLDLSDLTKTQQDCLIGIQNSSEEKCPQSEQRITFVNLQYQLACKNNKNSLPLYTLNLMSEDEFNNQMQQNSFIQEPILVRLNNQRASNLNFLANIPTDDQIINNDLYFYQDNDRIFYATRTSNNVIRKEIIKEELQFFNELLTVLKNPNPETQKVNDKIKETLQGYSFSQYKMFGNKGNGSGWVATTIDIQKNSMPNEWSFSKKNTAILHKERHKTIIDTLSPAHKFNAQIYPVCKEMDRRSRVQAEQEKDEKFWDWFMMLMATLGMVCGCIPEPVSIALFAPIFIIPSSVYFLGYKVGYKRLFSPEEGSLRFHFSKYRKELDDCAKQNKSYIDLQSLFSPRNKLNTKSDEKNNNIVEDDRDTAKEIDGTVALSGSNGLLASVNTSISSLPATPFVTRKSSFSSN